MEQPFTKWKPVGIATVLHFLVDGLCLCSLSLMAAYASMKFQLALFLIYNITAFMTQPMTGWWADCLRRRQTMLPLATGLLAAAIVLQLAAALWWGFLPALAVAVAFLLGMGNSLFHVWGGRLTATLSGNDMRAMGVFVSSGVLGLTVGFLYPSWYLLAGMLLFMLPGIILLGRTQVAFAEVCTPPSPPLPKPTGWMWFWLLFILTFVLLRSFLGEVVSAGLDKTSGLLLLLAVTAMAGKAGGGWLAQGLGISHAIVACVGIAAACMMWRGTEVIPLLPIVLGVFAINLTMPMTLHLSNRLLPHREGLSFGMLAAVLVPGYLLAKGVLLSPDHRFMLSALLLTIAIEVGMLMLMGERRRGVLAGAVAVNILTNVPLNIFLLTYGYSAGRLVAGELLVLVGEMLWYFMFVHQWRRAAIYSLLCNATSFLAGILIQYLIIYSL